MVDPATNFLAFIVLAIIAGLAMCLLDGLLVWLQDEGWISRWP